MNDSGQTIRTQQVVFEQVGGSKRFQGDQWAFWSMEPGRCMEIVFADIGRVGCPEGRRPNAWFTPTRDQGVDFWTGAGQFRVLWEGEEIAVCDIAAGVCPASVPPN